MATSGTATWSPSLSEIFQEAYDRAGLPFQSGYDWVSAKRSFNLLAAEFANRGLNMWTFDSENTPLVAGTATITAEQVGAGTTNAVLRATLDRGANVDVMAGSR